MNHKDDGAAVAPVDDDAERRLAEIRSHVAHVAALVGQEAEMVQGHVTFLLRQIDSRDAALREAQGRHGAVIAEFARAKTDWMTWRTGMEVALREAREERDRLRAALWSLRDAGRNRKAGLIPVVVDVLAMNEWTLDRPPTQEQFERLSYTILRVVYDELARSQPATPSPDRCPVHQAFMVELDGSRRCSFVGCDWHVAATPSPVPHDYDGGPVCVNCGVRYNRVTTSTWCPGSSASTNGDSDGKQPLREAEMRAVLRDLVVAYIANIGKPGAEFIKCVTPGHRSELGNSWAKGSQKWWDLWDRARSFTDLPPPATVADRQDTVEAPDESKQSGIPEAGSSGASAEGRLILAEAESDYGAAKRDYVAAQRLAPYPRTPDCFTHERIAAALSAARAGGERAGLERAAQWCETERTHHDSLSTSVILSQVASSLRALLPPAAPETKP